MVDIPILNGGYKPTYNWGGTTLQNGLDTVHTACSDGMILLQGICCTAREF